MNFKEWLLAEEQIPFATLKNWYDFHRGRWAEVEQARRANPKLDKYIANLEQNCSREAMGRAGNVIEKTTRQSVPNHGYHRREQQPTYRPTPPPSTQQGVPPEYRSEDHLGRTVQDHERRLSDIEARLQVGARNAETRPMRTAGASPTLTHV